MSLGAEMLVSDVAGHRELCAPLCSPGVLPHVAGGSIRVGFRVPHFGGRLCAVVAGRNLLAQRWTCQLGIRRLYLDDPEDSAAAVLQESGWV